MDIKNIRIGYPYLLRHSFQCDHLFIISEVRLTDPHKDSKLITGQIVAEEVFARKYKKSECDVCEENLGSFAIAYEQNISDG